MVISNKLILQWGEYANGTNTFPLSFSSKVSLAVTGEYSWNQVTKIKTLAKTKFTVETDASTTQSPIKTYIAVGY